MLNVSSKVVLKVFYKFVQYIFLKIDTFSQFSITLLKMQVINRIICCKGNGDLSNIDKPFL